MRILITGVSGLLGLSVASTMSDANPSVNKSIGHFLGSNFEVQAMRWGIYKSHPVAPRGFNTFPLDLTNRKEVGLTIREKMPEVILHTAGMTNVDACESDTEEAERQNIAVVEYIAEAAKEVSARLIHISTDHLSDGTQPFVTEDAPAFAVNEYARTKLKAEEVVAKVCPDALIIRTNFFGWGTPFKTSLSSWILDGLKEGRTLSLFNDVYITPVLINDLWDIIIQLLESKEKGIFNVAGRERVSKYAFGVELAKAFHYCDNCLKAVSVKDVPLRAPRPLDMSLNTDKIKKVLGKETPSLGESFARLKRLGEEGWPDMLRQAVK